MKNLFLVLLMCCSPIAAYGHSCNDVFQVVKDNLAVKVDIQDAQMHMNEHAKFRVYLLNSIDFDIHFIQLDVVSDAFDAIVKPSKEWREYPCLRTISEKNRKPCTDVSNPNNIKGKKEYFEVELIRKPDTLTGKYKVGLRIYTKDSRIPGTGGELLAIGNIEDAMSVMVVPKITDRIEIDGNVSAAEWKNSLLCTSFYANKPVPMSLILLNRNKEDYILDQKAKSAIQTRFRFAYKEDRLFCLVDFLTKSQRDIAKIYLAKDRDSSPVIITADLQGKEAVVSGRNEKAIRALARGSKMELEIPLDVLDLKNIRTLYLNMARDYSNETTFWRGNSKSYIEPMVYEKLQLE